MDRSDVVKLIKVITARDEYGVYQKTEEAREVYCSVDSVTQTEFFEGGRNGLNPEYRITLFRYDYDDESVVEYDGKRYGVYRTYHGKDDTLELYVERKGGVNG